MDKLWWAVIVVVGLVTRLDRCFLFCSNNVVAAKISVLFADGREEEEEEEGRGFWLLVSHPPKLGGASDGSVGGRSHTRDTCR
jgi:hypothetical protein